MMPSVQERNCLLFNLLCGKRNKTSRCERPLVGFCVRNRKRLTSRSPARTEAKPARSKHTSLRISRCRLVVFWFCSPQAIGHEGIYL